MSSILRSPSGLFVLLAVLAVALYVFLRPSPGLAGPAHGPQYDLIFGVNTFDPNFQTAVTLSPFIFDDTLYLEADRLPAHEGTVSTWVTLYRYDCKTGTAEPLPMPSASEVQHIEGKQRFVLSATKGLPLYTEDTSPDGYSLAEPEWVPVNPINNVLGNIVLFLFSGGFETIKEREEVPRLAKGDESVAMQSKRPLFHNDGDNAFLLGWVVPGK